MARRLPKKSDIEQALSGARRALHPRELAKTLDIPERHYEGLIELLDQLDDEGRLKTLPGGRVRLRDGSKKREEETWNGALTVHPKGFGFVMAAGRPDVFIPPDGIYEALHGDTVLVRVVGRSAKGSEGRVDGIIQRRSPLVAGVIQKKRHSCWLDPDDSRLRGPIVISEGAERAKDGDAAIVRITQFPEFADELPEAELVETLGPQGDPRTEVRKILVREEVSEDHEPETLQDAEKMAKLLRRPKLTGRVDLRDIPLPTIDPEDARDHDDAIWVERVRGGYRAYVAIADVSEYVRPESPLDEEARSRGCTIYLPDRAIPMLPRALAADLCSLLPEVDRYCMCVIAEIDRTGRTKKFDIVEGVMRSSARLTYGGVARALGLDPESPESPAAEAMKPNLEVLQELAEKLRKNRMKRGALDLDLPEPRVVLDDESGAPIEVKKRATRPGMKRAYQLVEEMMLLANELVGTWLIEKKAPAIFRVHDTPDEEKLERLADVADGMGIRVSAEDLAEPLGCSKFLAKAHKHERSSVLEMLMLRSLKQATYDTTNVGHFGLASEQYVHFTSPIRRYPDLRVHRQIKHILRGGKIDRSTEAVDDLREAATESSKKERAAMDVEREVVDLYRTLYMKRHLGDVFEGRVTGISGGGLYLALDDPFVDVMIRFDSLGPDRYELSDDELSVVGNRSGETIGLGDTLTVEIIDVAVLRRTTYGRRLTGDEGDEDEFEGASSLKRGPRRSESRRSESRRSESRRSESRRSDSRRAEPRRGDSPRSESQRGGPSTRRTSRRESESAARSSTRGGSSRAGAPTASGRTTKKTVRASSTKTTGKTASRTRSTAKTASSTRRTAPASTSSRSNRTSTRRGTKKRR